MSILEFAPSGALNGAVVARMRAQWEARRRGEISAVLVMGSALRYHTPEGLGEFAALLEAWHAEEPELPIWLCHLEPEIVLARQLADIGPWWQVAPDHATVLWELGLRDTDVITATTVLAPPPHDSGARSSGLPALDGLLSGGFEPGTVWCVEGAAGAGKTLLGLHFLAAGLARQEPGLYITAAEPPTKSAQAFARSWPTLEAGLAHGTLAVLDPSPFFTELRLAKERGTRGKVDPWDEVWRFVQDVTRQARNAGAKRIVIDPLTPLLLAHTGALDLWDTTQTLVAALSDSLGATTLLTHTTLFRAEFVTIGGVLATLCHGALRVEMHEGSGLVVHGVKRRHAAWGRSPAQVTLDATSYAPRGRATPQTLEHTA